MVESPINEFHQKVYIPTLKKFKLHHALVVMLGKNYCKEMRTRAFLTNDNWFLSEMDYAERLQKELNGEIQSDHFGENSTLSIEGCTLQYHQPQPDTNKEVNPLNPVMDFHSHMSDYSRQDAATTFEHMCVMFDHHQHRHGTFPKNAVLLDHTDGCAKQYRCGNALFLLNILSIKYRIVIDRSICAESPPMVLKYLSKPNKRIIFHEDNLCIIVPTPIRRKKTHSLIAALIKSP